MIKALLPRLLGGVCGSLFAVFSAPVAAEAPSDPYFLSDMVPAGHWAARLESRYGETDTQYDSQGHRTPLSAESDGVTLDASVIPLLGLLGSGASLGTTSVSTRINGTRERLTVGYGITDNVTIGFILPYGTLHNRVRFAMEGGNLGINPLFNPSLPVSPSNSPLLPLAYLPSGTPPAGSAGVEELLTNPVFGYGYKAPRSVTTAGILDPTLGVRWRAYAGSTDQLIVTPQLRIGMTEPDDPHNLFDAHLDDGSTDLIMELEYQRRLSARFDARVIGKYTWQLPDHMTDRAMAVGESLVPYSRTEKLDRNLGDALESTLELGYRIGDWRASTGVELLRRQPDRYHSPRGQDVSGLERNTRRQLDTAMLGLSWSGVRAYRAHRLPLPLFVSASYRGTYRGENAVASDNVFLTVTAIF